MIWFKFCIFDRKATGEVLILLKTSCPEARESPLSHYWWWERHHLVKMVFARFLHWSYESVLSISIFKTIWTSYFSPGFCSLVSASIIDVFCLNPLWWCWANGAFLIVPLFLTFISWRSPVRGSFPFYLIYLISMHSWISVLFSRFTVGYSHYFNIRVFLGLASGSPFNLGSFHLAHSHGFSLFLCSGTTGCSRIIF